MERNTNGIAIVALNTAAEGHPAQAAARGSRDRRVPTMARACEGRDHHVAHQEDAGGSRPEEACLQRRGGSPALEVHQTEQRQCEKDEETPIKRFVTGCAAKAMISGPTATPLGRRPDDPDAVRERERQRPVWRCDACL
jgi:hypothetical protein